MWDCFSRGQVVKLELKEVSAAVAQRPAAAAIKVDAKMDRLQVMGVPTGGAVPVLVNSIATSSHAALLATIFETNPLDGLCDQRVKLNSQPLEIIYDAVSMNDSFLCLILTDSRKRKHAKKYNFSEIMLCLVKGLV